MSSSLSPFAPENLVSRDGFGSSVRRQPAHLHSQAESGASLRNSSRVPRRCPFIIFKPPYAIRSVPSSSAESPPAKGSHSPIGGGWECNNYVPAFRGDGTKIAPPGNLFDHLPGEMN